MLQINVERFDKSAFYTLSKFYINGEFAGYGIEDPVRDEKIFGETAIPAGTYTLRLTHSPKFSKEYYRDNEGNLILANKRKTTALQRQYNAAHELVLIDNVPNYSRVLIHWGNTTKDTHGCYLIGSGFAIDKEKKTAALFGSRKKYTQIYPTLFSELRGGTGVIVFR